MYRIKLLRYLKKKLAVIIRADTQSCEDISQSSYLIPIILLKLDYGIHCQPQAISSMSSK